MSLKLLMITTLFLIYVLVFISGTGSGGEPGVTRRLEPPDDGNWIRVGGVEVEIVFDTNVSSPILENCVLSDGEFECDPKAGGRVIVGSDGEVYVRGVRLDVSGKLKGGKLRVEGVLIDFSDLEMENGEIVVSGVVVKGEVFVSGENVIVVIDSPNTGLVVVGDEESLKKSLIVGAKTEISGGEER